MPIRVALGFLVAALSLSPPAALAQRPVELAFSDPQPHFVAAWAPKKPREAERSAVLLQRVSLELADVPLDLALKTLTDEADLNITYSPAVLPASKRVTIKAGDIAVVTALTEMLFKSGLDVMVDRDGAMALVVCRHPAPRAEILDSGTIVGTVTDKATGAPIAGATVAVEGTSLTATTAGDGRYRLTDIPAGTRRVQVRFIGYAPLESSVEVPRDTEVTADFALGKSTQKLDELVTVTPGGMQTSLKALPTPVTVITAEDIERQRPATLASVFRQAVPSGVSPTPPSSPVSGSFSARGASSLFGLGSMKVFLDGVEVSVFATSAVDPSSVERIEVIRGPQATAVYGTDAVGGVVQITTKRGSRTLTRPQVMVQALGGAVETPYDGVGSAFRSEYTASVRGSSTDVSYNFGASYKRLGDWLPNGEISRQSSPSVYGGMEYSSGMLAADLHARHSRNNLGSVRNPDFLTAGFVPFSRPDFLPEVFTNETYGSRISVIPTAWWRNQLTLGVDRYHQDQRQAQPRLTTPDDTLLVIFDNERRKSSVVFNSSVSGRLGINLSGALTAGVDYYRSDASTFTTSNALQTDGVIQTSPPGTFRETRATVTNSGYFAQGEGNWRETVFLTAGVRADDNSTFGSDLSTPVSPRAGLSVVRQIGDVTFKVRGAYGRAIRAPAPGAALGTGGGGVLITLPNPLLQPEQQQGWDGGIDLVFGDRATLSVTGFTQTARDLITSVQLPSDSVLTFQNQNIGRVTNKGVEVEGTVTVGPARLTGQYGYVRSRVEELGPGASAASVQVGDEPLGVPKHTAGASLTLTPWAGTTLIAGFTYVGSYPNTDFLALVRCFAGTGSCQPTQRGYVIRYPSLTKINLALDHRLTRQVDAILAVDNLTNHFAFENSNTVAVTGRTTMVGLRARL